MSEHLETWLVARAPCFHSRPSASKDALTPWRSSLCLFRCGVLFPERDRALDGRGASWRPRLLAPEVLELGVGSSRPRLEAFALGGAAPCISMAVCCMHMPGCLPIIGFMPPIIGFMPVPMPIIGFMPMPGC